MFSVVVLNIVCLRFFVLRASRLVIARVLRRGVDQDAAGRKGLEERLRMRGCWNTDEIVLFELSKSMKPYPSVLHECTSNLRPVIGLF